MTRNSKRMTSYLLPAFFWTFAATLLCLRAGAQTSVTSAPLTAEEVVQHMTEKNEMRAKALANYSSVRIYHLECHCISHKKADMVVRADYQSPDTKEFTVVSESGSDAVRHKIFDKLMDAEKESMQEDNQQRSAVTLENYTFRLVDYQKTATDEYYVLDAQPKTKNKFLVRGRIWVDANDFAITRVEGEPAVNPSWWTVRTDFKRKYTKIGDFWLPESNESETKVRILGTAVLTITYTAYQITKSTETALSISSATVANGQ